jgi:hypothetical protein
MAIAPWCQDQTVRTILNKWVTLFKENGEMRRSQTYENIRKAGVLVTTFIKIISLKTFCIQKLWH